MAGSLIPVPYQRENKEFYIVKRDESNSRASVWDNNDANPVPLFPPDTGGKVPTLPPKGWKERYCNTYLNSDPRIKRRFPIGNPAAMTLVTTQGSRIYAPVSPGGTAVRWNITNSNGEKNPANLSLSAADTGQDDGTAPGWAP